jgi:hypothetical protein
MAAEGGCRGGAVTAAARRLHRTSHAHQRWPWCAATLLAHHLENDLEEVLGVPPRLPPRVALVQDDPQCIHVHLLGGKYTTQVKKRDRSGGVEAGRQTWGARTSAAAAKGAGGKRHQCASSGAGSRARGRAVGMPCSAGTAAAGVRPGGRALQHHMPAATPAPCDPTCRPHLFVHAAAVELLRSHVHRLQRQAGRQSGRQVSSASRGTERLQWERQAARPQREAGGGERAGLATPLRRCPPSPCHCRW